MIKNIVSALALVVSMTFFTLHVSAAAFSLTKIGALDLGGKTYPEWWYTGINPTFVGTGDSGKTVKVTAGEVSGSTTVDSSGNWSVYLQLAQGDYDVAATQESSTISFKLHLGQALPENLSTTSSQTSQSTTGVPSTGFNQIAAMGFGIGIALLASYFYISSDSDRKLAFEKKILREDK